MALTKIDDRGLKTPIDLLDNEKIRFGTGNDLEIYHSTDNNSYIHESGSGSLVLKADDLYIQNAAGSHTNILADSDGRVELSFNGNKKFETTSTGITVTGGLIKDGSGEPIVSNQPSGGNTANPGLQLKNDGTINGSWRYDGRLEVGGQDSNATAKIDPAGHIFILNDTGKLQLGASQELQIYHDGSNSYVNSTEGDLYVQSKVGGDDVYVWSQDDIFLKPQNGEDGLTVNGNGGVELYWDGSLKFETTSEGVETKGEIHLKAPSNATGEQVGRIEWWNENDAGVMAKIGVDRTADQYAPADLVFSTNANVDTAANGSDGDITERMRIDSSGNVGIATNDPSARLQINTSHYVPTSSGKSTTGIHLDGNWGNAGEYGGGISFGVGRTGAAAIAARQMTSQGNVVGLSFFTHDSSTASDDAVEKVRIMDGGVTCFNNGIGLGNGLTLSANNTLNDYEEGTFQANIKFGGASANIAHTDYAGRYTKVGRLVTCSFVISLSNKGTSTGNATINALPFTSTNDSSDRMWGLVTHFSPMTNVTSQIVLYNTTNEDKIGLYDSSSTQVTAITDANFENNTLIRGFIQYHAA